MPSVSLTQKVSLFQGNAPDLDTVGQNDGALDLAMWDEDLGAYWGLVRVDVVGPPEPMPWGGAQGFRRTGRFTTKDFRTFSPAQQVFHGRQGYEICKAHRRSVFRVASVSTEELLCRHDPALPAAVVPAGLLPCHSDVLQHNFRRCTTRFHRDAGNRQL